MVEVIFWLVTILIVYRFNRDLHKDIFNGQFCSFLYSECVLYLGCIGILWSWKVKPFNKVSQEHGGVKVGMRLKLKDDRWVEVKGIVHFPTKYIVQDENKNEFQVFTHEVVR